MLKLVKTLGGSDGAPEKCNRCEQNHFVKSGIAWHCASCGIYYPTVLGFDSLKDSIRRLNELQDEVKFHRQQLEDLARK